MSEGWRTFEHTGDLGLEVWAESPERLYAAAVVALSAQMIEVQPTRARAGTPAIEVALALAGDDPADLFVHWLNTSLVEAEVRQAAWTSAEVRLPTPLTIEGRLAGVPRDRATQVFLREIKAVSHHALELDLTPGACRCRMILDL
jgi:SHS2 domain-containing protein